MFVILLFGWFKRNGNNMGIYLTVDFRRDWFYSLGSVVFKF